MRNDNRLHRPHPERTAPMRNFSNLYRRPSEGAEERMEPEGNFWRPGDGFGTPPNAGPQWAEALTGGVQLAYQVIERYITEGRRTAERLAQQPYNMRAFGGNFQQVAELMLRYSTEMMPIWFEMLRVLVDSGTQYSQGMQTAPPQEPPREESSQRGTLPISLEIASKLPIRVQFDLKPGADLRQLAVLGLRSLDSTKPELTGVTLVPPSNGGPPGLRVKIPDDQPSGTYLGIIADRNTSESRGTLTITVVEETEQRQG